MKNQQRLLVGLILALVLIIFALLNGQAVTVNFFGATFHWPLIVVIVVSVLIGALIAILTTTANAAQQRKAMAALKKDHQALQQDVQAQIKAATKTLTAENEALKAQLKTKA
ncbi:lipopolysaccharide assembly LapA domain-containing protein [Lacticaseibacillus baoqingensis]|uniref:Lipopolysaccharide assembly LapA domain-containing protein n=1 Tax=Lacticaseibacillus baoqingensis TaxID=2486013 RepID=A0ABW4E8P9_9LACO|nr:lipopolysaccharide assembly protein LapA domain-containing protein [Lacticaseibacillus baoqingensis]